MSTAEKLFSDCKYVRFNNEVPPSVYSASKECTAFDLLIPMSRNWKESENRLLVICEHVHTEDLRNGKLLSGQSLTLFRNCWKYATKLANDVGEPVHKFSVAAINYNFFKTYHLSPQQTTEMHIDSICAKRIRKFIEKVQPTHIFISGSSATNSILRNVLENSEHKLGWVHKLEINGVKLKAVTSLDYIQAISKKKKKFDDDDDDENDENDKDMAGAYTLGYFCRNLRNCLIQKNPYKVSIAANPKLVNTIEKFDKMMEILEKADRVAVDTETQNLNRVRNKIYTIQFATRKDRGYVVPYLHPETPFNSSELQYIRNRLRKFFSKPVDIELDTDKYKALLMFNGKFDLTQLRQQFGVRVIHWPVYDIRAGEFLLDENLRFIKDVTKVGIKRIYHGGLAQTLCNYGEDFYYRAKFSKQDRGDMDNTSIHNQHFLEYGSMDVQCLIAIAEKQIQRARDDKYVQNGKVYTYEKDFIRMAICQMSNNIHVFSNMEHRGVNIDKKHLLYLKTKQSPISKSIAEAAQKIYKSKYVQQANEFILEKKSIPTGNTIFDRKPFVFNINKPEHKIILFIDIMQLEPITYGKSGAPSLGKLFKKTYESVKEVARLNELEKAKKLKSSYVDSFVRALSEGDGAVDGRLRPSFDFFPVVTGRSNSSDPSLQQIPQRGENAKYIKRMFTASRGKLLIKQDYSAHEIRMWSVISLDMVLAKVFQIGRNLRRKFYQTGKNKYKREINLKGDVHRLNVEFFFKVPVEEVTDEQRNDIKGVGFGAIYGKSPKTLAKELKKAVEFMEDLFKRYFGQFKKASGWLEWAKSFSEANLFVKSIIGRRRYLFGYLTEINRIVAAMKRRAMNSPIQGMGADLGHTSSRLFSIELEKALFKLKRIDDSCEMLPANVEVMVHDSTRLEAPFDIFLICTHILQWCATQGVVSWYKKYHGFDFTVYPEVEMEFGVDESRMYKWNWSLTGDPEEKDKSFSLEHCLKMAAKDYCELYPEDNLTYKKVMKKIYADWENSKVKKYLDDNYPILPEDGKGE